jgi:16S rRNA (guanine966-N2)-methyltransferase
VRPTRDRIREALFNRLAHNRWRDTPLPQDAGVVDGFAGTGALGLEALSRGAAHVTFLENDPAALDLLRENAALFDAADQITILNCDATRPGRARRACDLVLLDPPYGGALAEPALAAFTRGGWLTPGALAVIELAAKEPFEPPSGFELIDERLYGASRVVILRWPG